MLDYQRVLHWHVYRLRLMPGFVVDVKTPTGRSPKVTVCWGVDVQSKYKCVHDGLGRSVSV